VLSTGYNRKGLINGEEKENENEEIQKCQKK